jgi:hypothetical protein
MPTVNRTINTSPILVFPPPVLIREKELEGWYTCHCINVLSEFARRQQVIGIRRL